MLGPAGCASYQQSDQNSLLVSPMMNEGRTKGDERLTPGRTDGEIKLTVPSTFSGKQRRQQFDEATAGLNFSKDFNTSLEAIITDEMATIGHRFLAWIKRRAWGNYSLCAIKDNGLAAFQRDCAAELGVDKSKLSNVITYYERRGYVRREGKLLYPVIAPVLTSPPVDDKVNYSKFMEWWKVAKSSTFLDMQEARSVIARARKVLRADYKQWRDSATNPAPSLYENLESKEERAAAAVLSVVEDPPPLSESDDTELVTAALNRYGAADPGTGRAMLDKCRAFAADATAEAICSMIDFKGRRATCKDNPIGFLLTVVPPAFEAWTPRIPVMTETRPTPLSEEEAAQIYAEAERRYSQGLKH